MARLNPHPGVSKPWHQSENGVCYLTWRDPRDKQHRRNNSTETKDFVEATRIAMSLSRQMQNPERWDDPPEDIHPIAAKIWGIDPLGRKVTIAKLAHLDATFAAQERDATSKNFPEELVKALLGRKMERPSDLREALEKWASIGSVKKRDDWILKGDEVYQILDRMLQIAADRDRWRERARALEGMIQEKGKKFVLATEPKSLLKAVEDFMDSPQGTTSKGQWRRIVSYRLKRMARNLGKDKSVHDLTPEDIIEHIQNQKGNSTTKKSLTTYICMFMSWATREQFDVKTVRSAIVDNLETENEEWFWLTREEAFLLIEKLRAKHGDYWGDAALIQYGCGFRAEEIPMLKRSNVFMQEGKTEIRIEPIFDGKKLVRRVKTIDSSDKVSVPSWAMPALERRMNAGEFLLFSLYDDALVPPRAWVDKKGKNTRSQFEKSKCLWPSADECAFPNCYRPRLRDGAKDAQTELLAKIAQAKSLPKNAKTELLMKKESEMATRLAVENIDSRTFRRTCAREMVMAYGFEKAAAVLRDSVETLRKHYADLQASDVSTER